MQTVPDLSYANQPRGNGDSGGTSAELAAAKISERCYCACPIQLLRRRLHAAYIELRTMGDCCPNWCYGPLEQGTMRRTSQASTPLLSSDLTYRRRCNIADPVWVPARRIHWIQMLFFHYSARLNLHLASRNRTKLLSEKSVVPSRLVVTFSRRLGWTVQPQPSIFMCGQYGAFFV